MTRIRVLRRVCEQWRWPCRLQGRGVSSSSSSSSSSGSGGGPDPDKVRAVTFTKSQAQALEAYDEHHRSLFSYVPSFSPEVREKFLPFWGVAAKARVRVESASIGVQAVSFTYDANQRRHRPVVSMVYRTVRWSGADAPSWTSTYDPSEPDMQMYASYDYRRGYVDGIKTRDTFRGASKLFKADADLEPFKMRPSAALKTAKEVIYSRAKVEAKSVLLRQLHCDSVMNISLQVDVIRIFACPVYVPVYIFESNYLGQLVRTFVHGSTLATGGQRVYSSSLAIAAGAASLAYAGLTGTYSPASILIPITVAGLVSVIYPLLAVKLRGWLRSTEEAEASKNFGAWDEAYVVPLNSFSWDDDEEPPFDSWFRDIFERVYQQYGRSWQQDQYQQQRKQQQYQQQQKQQQYQQQQQSRQRYQQYPWGDPMGYYAKLGLKPGASETEIKSAFRSLALKHHPDRFSDPKEADRAKVKFQEITAAYQVLRDARKRKVYNETGAA